MAVIFCTQFESKGRYSRIVITNYCAFSKDHLYPKWANYELTRYELEEADRLCHDNMIEIQHLREYINQLQAVLTENGIKIPVEY